MRCRTTAGQKSEPVLEPAPPWDETGPGPQQGSGLRPGEAHHRGLLERGPDAVLVAAPHGTILLANQRAAELFGHPSPEAATGQRHRVRRGERDPAGGGDGAGAHDEEVHNASGAGGVLAM
jgi:PAS domain-containing protein